MKINGIYTFHEFYNKINNENKLNEILKNDKDAALMFNNSPKNNNNNNNDIVYEKEGEQIDFNTNK